MRLTRAGEYGIRCVLFLAGLPYGQVIKSRDVSEQMGVPHHFLAKIAQQLASADIIRIEQGVKGGFALARAPEKITILDVVEAVEGPIFLNNCILEPESCHRSSFCPVHDVWGKAVQSLKDALRSANFKDMVECEHLRKKADHQPED